MKKLAANELIQIVLASFEAERTNDVSGGLKLLTKDFQKTSMVVSDGVVFPQIKGRALHDAVNKAYAVKGREFHIFTTAANESTQTVFVELVEIEPRDNETVLWPYVLVCQVDDGKISRTRHYGDPALLRKNLSLDHIKALID